MHVWLHCRIFVSGWTASTQIIWSSEWNKKNTWLSFSAELVICIGSKSSPCLAALTDVYNQYKVCCTFCFIFLLNTLNVKWCNFMISKHVSIFDSLMAHVIDFTLNTKYINHILNVSVHSKNSLSKQRSALCNYCPLNSPCEYLKSYLNVNSAQRRILLTRGIWRI